MMDINHNNLAYCLMADNIVHTNDLAEFFKVGYARPHALHWIRATHYYLLESIYFVHAGLYVEKGQRIHIIKKLGYNKLIFDVEIYDDEYSN